MAQNTQHAYTQSTHTDAACAEQVAVRVAAQINTWFDIRAQIFISVEISGLEVQRGGGLFLSFGGQVSRAETQHLPDIPRKDHDSFPGSCAKTRNRISQFKSME